MADRLSEILKNTLITVEGGKEEIFLIAETTRTETQRLTQEFQRLRVDLELTIEQVDRQQKIERQLRQKLMEVSRDYRKYSEKEMMESYSQAKDAQLNLQLLQAREAQLRNRRDEIERSLRQMQLTIERAENLVTQIGMAINLIQGGILEIGQSSDTRHEIGLRVIKAQEEERRRVAREIHDGPAQTLANIVLRLEIAEKLLELDTARVKSELADLKRLVRNNLQDIRRIIFDLRPMALDDLGVVPALQKYTENFRHTYDIEIELKVEGREKRLHSAIEVALFRIIQEAITNSAKHSGTNKVTIIFRFDSEMILIEVIDYGKGFDVDAALTTPGDHYGLLGMKERVEMFSGQIEITSDPYKATGTKLKINIPSNREEMVVE